MKQYCRYCSYCCCNNVPYCDLKNKYLTYKSIKHINKCKEFAFNKIDAINGGIYKEREKKNKEDKINIFDFVEENK